MPSRISLIDDDQHRAVQFLPGAHVRGADGGASTAATSHAVQASRDELLRHHAALLDAQREHRELTELIVHDLKAPLSALRAGLDWMRAHLPPGQGELVEAIADADVAARRLNAMIGDLLVVSRMDQGELPLQRQPVSLRSLFDLIVHSYARRARDKGIALTSSPDGDAEVTADPPLLQRVMENLVENALRYTHPNGRIRLSALRRPGARARAVEIAVSNDGPTIPLPERARIFHKFARGQSEGPVPGSAGLGLYFCKRAVEAHGGAIAIVDTPGWPTSFRICLP